jgi:hypothetical protein
MPWLPNGICGEQQKGNKLYANAAVQYMKHAELPHKPDGASMTVVVPNKEYTL